MRAGYITISRRKYAAGLFWQPAPARGGSRESAARLARASKTHASLYVSFGGMIGLAPRHSGARAGLVAAAAEVMEGMEESTFLAAFSVREGIWLLAVRGGIIIRDLVFANVAAARAEYDELNAMPDWGILIAPADWSAPSAVERRLTDIVAGSRKYKLASISHLPAHVLTLVLLGAAAFVGYTFFKDPLARLIAPRARQVQLDPAAVAEYKKKLAELDAPKPKAPPKKVHVIMPFEDLADIAERSGQCWRAIAFLAQPITGWVVDSAVCADGEASAHLRRGHGTIGDLYAGVREKMPNVAVEEAGGGVILTARLKGLKKASRPPEYSAEQVMTAVQSVFQRIEEDISFMRDFEELSLPDLGDNEAPDTDKTEIPVVRIEAASKLEPLEFVKILDGVSAVDIKSVKWDNRARNWNYEVVIYVK